MRTERRGATDRGETDAEHATTAGHADATLELLRRQAATCVNCPLHRDATQTVFGEGSTTARIMLVGEQPGDREDRAGEPFVGPAGGLLNRALSEAGMERESVYVTNVVKHFKFKRQGKRRIHQRPNRGEIDACLPWLHGELAALDPDVVVAMGATAARTLIGPAFRVTTQRGQPIEVDRRIVVATLHPSALLRADDEDRRGAFEELVDDLRTARRCAHL